MQPFKKQIENFKRKPFPIIIVNQFSFRKIFRKYTPLTTGFK